MNEATIVIKGNVNINISMNPLDVAAEIDRDDFFSQNLSALIARIFNSANSENSSCNSDESSQDCCANEKCDKQPTKWNINAPEFFPTKKIVDDASDDENDSDYVPESDEESDDETDSEEEFDSDKLDLFKNICKTKKIPYSVGLFKKYDAWSESNGKGLNRYAKMSSFLDNNKVIHDTGAKLKNDVAPEQRKEPIVIPSEILKVIQNAIAPAPSSAPTKKRDQAKVDLLQDVCEKFNTDYTNALFDEYEEWSKTHGAGLNRYKKMSQFLSEKTNKKSDNGDRA